MDRVCSSRRGIAGLAAVVFCLLLTAFGARADVVTISTMEESALRAALNPTGLSIDAISIRRGEIGQIGTYSNFITPPVTIGNGVVLSNGNVASLGPLFETTQPGYDPASPPEAVSGVMAPDGDGSTAEFNTYGLSSGNIENFQHAHDVAALEVRFSLEQESQIKFDFIFASVEYPYWTSQFTDSFLVFLDPPENPSDPIAQITYDKNGNSVQVGSSFAGLETTADLNTAFANPHGLLVKLTTTSPMLSDGEHVLWFEVGDVNDQVLDSVAFIANLRTGTGTEGTEVEIEPEDPQSVPTPQASGAIILLLGLFCRRPWRVA